LQRAAALVAPVAAGGDTWQKCEKTCVLGNSNDFVSVRVVLFGFGSSKQLENNKKSVEIEFVFRGRSSGMKRALTGALSGWNGEGKEMGARDNASICWCN
jgi:hypothetical protein